MFAALHLPNSDAAQPSKAQATSVMNSKEFLCETMRRPDLDDFMAWINAKIPIHDARFNRAPSNWAFTGSVAMQIHGHALDCQIAKNRKPHDVDIVTSEFPALEEERRTPHEKITEITDGTATFNFDHKFDVDVINCRGKNKRSFGTLQQDIQVIHGVPVMSLAALLISKQALLRDRLETGGHHETQSIASENTSSDHELDVDRQTGDAVDDSQNKIRADIAILKTLQETVVPPHLTQAYLTSGFPEPENIFR
ncbi:hypothetical protein GCM10022212_17400 [Actimicrobium antarcticum]|uniref:Nucleotidyl transferase AbiEii toxin, Type IV TA system n=2 Tax=Actimicrobium antarcticum TaxID=1051899 RepID=A0ABP7T581_9BURK